MYRIRLILSLLAFSETFPEAAHCKSPESRLVRITYPFPLGDGVSWATLQVSPVGGDQAYQLSHPAWISECRTSATFKIPTWIKGRNYITLSLSPFGVYDHCWVQAEDLTQFSELHYVLPDEAVALRFIFKDKELHENIGRIMIYRMLESGAFDPFFSCSLLRKLTQDLVLLPFGTSGKFQALLISQENHSKAICEFEVTEDKRFALSEWITMESKVKTMYTTEVIIAEEQIEEPGIVVLHTFPRKKVIFVDSAGKIKKLP